MPIILHKFRNHQINLETEILILGTFNPDIPNGPTFFYGRSRNYLWKLLPGCWGLPSLKNSPLGEKQDFMAEYKVDFVDLIASVDVPADQQANYLDSYIDSRVNNWKNIIELINQLPKLRAVFFTRMTFASIPNIRNKILEVRNHCNENREIRFCLLPTPARFANPAKQQQWIDTIINQITCLLPQ